MLAVVGSTGNPLNSLLPERASHPADPPENRPGEHLRPARTHLKAGTLQAEVPVRALGRFPLRKLKDKFAVAGICGYLCQFLSGHGEFQEFRADIRQKVVIDNGIDKTGA